MLSLIERDIAERPNFAASLPPARSHLNPALVLPISLLLTAFVLVACAVTELGGDPLILGAGLISGGLAAGGVFSLYMRRRVVRPLALLKDAILHAERSEWQKLGTTHEDEIGQVIAAFNRMVDSLARGQRELRDAMNATEQAARAKDVFLAHVSHELRTPLNAIIGFSQVMRDEMFGPLASDRYRGYAIHIHESGSHLLDVINQILDLSKIEAGKFELLEEPFVLSEIIHACVRLIAPQASKHGIEIVCEVAPDLPRMVGDEMRIRQIIFNLLSNGVKFTPQGGRVSVAAQRAHHGGVILTVSDNGIGMAPEDIPHALAPFRQVDSEMWKTREGTGTGLGLPLVKAFAELHGASFAIDSERGLGTSVTIGFPARRTLPGH
jgi:signal transduction histidine kinase